MIDCHHNHLDRQHIASHVGTGAMVLVLAKAWWRKLPTKAEHVAPGGRSGHWTTSPDCAGQAADVVALMAHMSVHPHRPVEKLDCLRGLGKFTVIA